VDDLLADVDRRAVEIEGLFDRVDRALDAGAIAPGRSEEHFPNHQIIVASGLSDSGTSREAAVCESRKRRSPLLRGVVAAGFS
jgi:hypothetical protein